VHDVTKGEDKAALDWEKLRLGIERCDADLLIGFCAEDARLSIVNAAAPHASPFELRGKAEIVKHLRVVFGPETSHRVERKAVVGDNRVAFQEACKYQDGGRVRVETTLNIKGAKIVRQVEVVTTDSSADRKEEIGQRLFNRKTQPDLPPRDAMVSPSDQLLRFQRATEKEDL
jgi:hypothetical protein